MRILSRSPRWSWIANLVVLARLGILVAVVSPGLLLSVSAHAFSRFARTLLVTAWWWHGMQK
jgi:hypothetical protein